MDKQEVAIKPKAQALPLKKEKLLLMCEWNDCKEISIKIDDFINHVKDQHLLSHDFDNNPNCPWQDCNFVAKSNREFSSHVYFHIYHAKIKSVGNNILHRRGTVCSLGTSGRNLIPEIPELFQCCWANCQEEFLIVEYFYRHVEKHAESSMKGNNPKGGVLCHWEKCDINFQNQHKLRDHLHSHTQEKVAACPTCGAFFANRTKLFDHVKRQTPVEMQDYQCSHCSKWFSSERLLRDHMRTHVNHYKCPCCDMTCPSPSGLNTHIKYRHTDLKPFSCDICEHSCKSQTDLRRHLETHNSDPPYKCCYPQCPFNTRSIQSIVNHMRKVHEGVKTCLYKCHMCEKNFNRGSSLTRHLIKQHKFRWPSGHSRFRYKCGDDGFYRLQTVRYESIELMQEMMVNDDISDKPNDIVENVTEITEQSVPGGSILELPVVLQDSDDGILISLEQNEDGVVVLQTVVPEKI